MNLLKKSIIQSFYAGTNILGKRKDDVYLVSFPKSGNTWVRFYLCNLINQMPQFHFTDDPIDFKMLDRTMVELGRNNLIQQWHFKGFPRIIKTHLAYSPLLGNRKTILIIRDPKDVMVSFFKYETTKSDNFYRRFGGNRFEDFIRHPKFGIESWCKHYLSWKAHADLIIKYEDIKLDDKAAFIKINNFLGIAVKPQIFETALELSRFDNIKKIEENRGAPITEKFGASFKFTRSGKTGQWKDFFSQQDIDFLNAMLTKYSINLY